MYRNIVLFRILLDDLLQLLHLIPSLGGYFLIHVGEQFSYPWLLDPFSSREFSQNILPYRRSCFLLLVLVPDSLVFHPFP